jgi:hypothetical protein
MDDLSHLDRHDDGRIPNGARSRKPCRRHKWSPCGIVHDDGETCPVVLCSYCGKFRDEARAPLEAKFASLAALDRALETPSGGNSVLPPTGGRGSGVGG